VYLLYNADKADNCVVTIKVNTTAAATSVYLEVQGKARVTDSGSFAFYAPGRCGRPPRTRASSGAARSAPPGTTAPSNTVTE
jgi:hypothetical protein